MTVHYRLRLAPSGHRCGLFFAAAGAATLTVFVLPKPWASRGAEIVPDGLAVFIRKDSLLLIGVEGEQVTVDAPPSLGVLLDGLAARIADDANTLAARRASDGQRRYEDPSSASEDADPGLGALLRIDRTRLPNPSPVLSAVPATLPHNALAALFDLATRTAQTEVWNSRPQADASEDEDAAAGGAVRGARTRAEADPLQLLAQWRLVELMRVHSRNLRRGYIPLDEETSVIRGRLTQRGLIQASSRIGLQVECAHDEFTDTTPLFRVLVTALERVASGVLAERHCLPRWSVLQQIRDRAVHLRRQLQQLPSLPRALAAAEAARLCQRPLPRTLRVWQPALHLARTILRDEALSTVEATDGVVTQHWWLNTSQLWEAILAEICVRAGWRVSATATGSGQPWLDLGVNKRPDLLLDRPDPLIGGFTRLVVDAKYKLLDTGRLNVADQYQLFTYSHTTTWQQGRADAAAVLYPQTCPGPPRAFARCGDGRFKLHLVGLPFPMPADLDEARWETYLSKSADLLRGSLAGARADPETDLPHLG